MTHKPRVLVICKSGRLHAILASLARRVPSTLPAPELFAFADVISGGVRALCVDARQGRTADVAAVVAYAKEVRADFVVIGPEEPLFAGVADALEDAGIPCMGPRKAVAKIEWSKAFGRRLLSDILPTVNPDYRVFTSIAGVAEYLGALGAFVIKPDGLTGGKGVKVSGDHLADVAEGVAYCQEIFASGHGELVIEEKLDGEEFTLQSFCDGTTVVHTIPVQDHKRLLDGDKGPNTGGMGSYTDANHSLPFLTADDLAAARRVNELVAAALLDKLGVPYKGILYGGFIATANGIKVIEFNSRFGDPEVMNVLPLLETDFLALCEALVHGRLTEAHVRFAHKASVCLYLVPAGYPAISTSPGGIVATSLPADSATLRLFHASIGETVGGIIPLMTSRALGVVGLGDTLAEAAAIAGRAAARIEGPLVHRADIGTAALIEARVAHMRRLRGSARHVAA